MARCWGQRRLKENAAGINMRWLILNFHFLFDVASMSDKWNAADRSPAVLGRSVRLHKADIAAALEPGNADF
jgi:hypothetical protein